MYDMPTKHVCILSSLCVYAFDLDSLHNLVQCDDLGTLMAFWVDAEPATGLVALLLLCLSLFFSHFVPAHFSPLRGLLLLYSLNLSLCMHSLWLEYTLNFLTVCYYSGWWQGRRELNHVMQSWTCSWHSFWKTHQAEVHSEQTLKLRVKNDGMLKSWKSWNLPTNKHNNCRPADCQMNSMDNLPWALDKQKLTVYFCRKQNKIRLLTKLPVRMHQKEIFANTPSHCLGRNWQNQEVWIVVLGGKKMSQAPQHLWHDR